MGGGGQIPQRVWFDPHPHPEAKSSEFRVQSSVGVWAIANGSPNPIIDGHPSVRVAINLMMLDQIRTVRIEHTLKIQAVWINSENTRGGPAMEGGRV